MLGIQLPMDHVDSLTLATRSYRATSGAPRGPETNRNAIMDLSTKIAVFLGCIMALLWWWSMGKKGGKAELVMLPLVVKVKPCLEVDDGKKRVMVFIRMQTGTIECFAKFPGFQFGIWHTSIKA